MLMMVSSSAMGKDTYKNVSNSMLKSVTSQ
ncbi:hypothetical protein A2U01_0104032, partial [Trifolium medium]|nr:hypothetical protein [Trifolium medium]